MKFVTAITQTLLLLLIGQVVYGQFSPRLTKIYDGRKESTQPKLSNQEKRLIENFVNSKEKEIKKFGKSKDFECEENSFQIDSVAQGFFTRKKLLQKAYLYSFCLSGQAQYATYLGGIVIVENNKPTGHYVFTNISGYNNLKFLSDINRNGYSEIVVEFAHSVNGLQFAKAIRIFDLAPSGLMEVASLETFSRLGELDKSYLIYAKTGRTPVFSREIYESEPQSNEWKLTQKRKNFSTNPPVYSSNNLDILPIFEFSAPTLTATEISQRILKLIKSIQIIKDISPQNIEKVTGLKMEFDPDNRKNYGTHGRVGDTIWFYILRSLSNINGEKPNRLQFAFGNMEDSKNESLSPICAVDFETYKKELISAGFSATKNFGEHGRHLGWKFSNLTTYIDVSDYRENVDKPNRHCVKSLIIQANYEIPLLEIIKRKKVERG